MLSGLDNPGLSLNATLNNEASAVSVGYSGFSVASSESADGELSAFFDSGEDEEHAGPEDHGCVEGASDLGGLIGDDQWLTQQNSARPGTVRWWKEKADMPVMEHGPWQSATVRQVAVSLTEAALKHNVRDSAFQDITKVFKQLCTQPGSMFPPSKYIMAQFMEPAPLEAAMYHLCTDCGKHVWQPLPRKEWKGHQNDTCPGEGCNGRRFKSHPESSAEIEPVSVSLESFNTIFVNTCKLGFKVDCLKRSI